jgi:hypothetical protein
MLRRDSQISVSKDDNLTMHNFKSATDVNHELQSTLTRGSETAKAMDSSSALPNLIVAPSTSASSMQAVGQYECNSISSYTGKVSSTCQFVKSVLSDNQLQVDINIPVKDFLRQHGLKIRSAPGNGHCLLHSWAIATQSCVEDIKQIILNEFTTNAATYVNAGIDGNQLLEYLNKNSYQLDAVDAVIDILCNATHIVAFVIGQKYDFSNPRRIRVVRNVTEIRRIAPSGPPSTHFVLLLKSREHYDAVV